MADCKKALEEAGGDMEAAIDVLRKKGAATAAKRADRSANEGVVATAISKDHSRGAIVEVNCETDFVARNEEFSSVAHKLAEQILEHQPADMDALMALEIDGKTVEQALHDLLGKFSERIEIKRFDVLRSDSGYVAAYVHHGDKLAVLIELSQAGDPEPTDAIARDVAMQVAAMNPSFVHRKDVPEAVLAKEREILTEQTINEGKKPEIAEKIVAGRIEKYFGDSCLLEQSFVKDSSKTVHDVMVDFGNEQNKEVTVLSFIRYNIGEATPETAAQAD
jgi:elongation factor Ts